MRALAIGVAVALLGCGDDDAAKDTAADTSVTETVATDTSTTETAVTDTEVPEVAPDTADTAETVEEVEVTPPCSERPNPFVYPDDAEAWRHYDQSSQIAALDPPNHRGQDVIIKAGEPQVLVAKFAYGLTDTDMKDEDVSIWMQREPPCGLWEHMGDFRTSVEDQYGTTYGIEDDGGRVFFEIPEAQRFPVGRYPVRMVLKGDLTMAAFDLIVVEPGTQAIVTDIDGTLTTGDEELILELIMEFFNETYVQHPYPDADRMLELWESKGYLIVYITGRPDPLRPMTERWVEPRFPPGPMHLTDTNTQAIPKDENVGTYKKEFVQYLQAQGLDIVAAYGNATTDIYAYEQAGIPKATTFIIGNHRGEAETQPLQGGYTDHLPWVEARPAATKPAPPAFGWW
ncbi:MAG: hypothetical protein IT385_17280 [Deltaproteobacteria bacterium]|nr:hypothetical protein [Deltaproteobacteria bacterium]